VNAKAKVSDSARVVVRGDVGRAHCVVRPRECIAKRGGPQLINSGSVGWNDGLMMCALFE
jgi:hypothetical protein